jgi:type IV pilus assembly protein PilW
MNTHRHQRGFSIIELMIGIAIGLVIVAAALVALTQTLRENRAVLLEARLTQDLGTAAELMTRDLRRAGHWGDSGAGVWRSPDVGVMSNPYANVDTAADADAVSFVYSRDAAENHGIDSNERFAYRLRSGVIEMQLGEDNWQAMTDASTMVVSALHITPQVQEISLSGTCSQACPAGSATCPPRQQVRSLQLQISARSATDGNVVRNLQSLVRLRNDALIGACPT